MKKFKKPIATLLALILAFGAFAAVPLTAGAYSPDDFSYTVLDDGTAEITGYSGSDTDLAIPGEIDGYKVTSIGEYAFEDCVSLESVIIPDGVTTIGCAFLDCKNLAEIQVPDSVTSMDGAAFNRTAWYNNYPDGVMYAGKVAYGYKGDMPENTTIALDEGTIAVADGAFYWCNNLAAMTIPDSVTHIGNRAFEECTSLTNVTIGSGVTSICENAFNECESLTDISVSVDNESYSSADGVLFDKEKTKLIRYMPGKTDESYAIPDSVTSIGDYAFNNCTNLTGIIIPDGLTDIGEGAFSWCENLTDLTIGNGVTSIDPNAFNYCEKLANINIGSENASYSSIDGVLFNKEKTELIKYPKGKTDESYAIPDSVTSVGDFAFEGCESLTQITISGGVTSIGDYAFEECSNLAGVIIPDSVTNIGEGAFAWCESLTDLALGNGVKSIGGNAFKYCESLTSVIIPDSVTTIGYDAFFSCTNLTDVTIGNGVTSIGSNAFSLCNSLTDIVIPKSVEEIGENPFYCCENLTDITVEDGNENFYDDGGMLIAGDYEYTQTYEFSYDLDLYSRSWTSNYKNGTVVLSYPAGNAAATVTIPDGVVAINDDAFVGCKAESIIFPEGLECICENAFSYCNNLKAVSFPDSLECIESDAFSHCESLSEISLNEGIEIICFEAFGGSPLLKSVELPIKFGTIAYDAFYDEYSDFEKPEIVGYENTAAKTYADDFGYTFRSLGAAPTEMLYDYQILEEGTAAINAYYGIEDELTLPSEIGGKAVTCIQAKKISDEYDDWYYYEYSDNRFKSSTIVIPDSVTTIGFGAFEGCENLLSVTIPGSVTDIGECAFAGCSSLTSITIPDSVTNIGDRAFEDCTSLESIIISDGVTSVGYEAFSGCSSLTSITIPDSVTDIGDWAFEGCTSLESIIISEGVTSIGYDAFNGCISLESIKVDGNNANYSSVDGILFNKEKTELIVYPKGKAGESYAIPDGVTSVGVCAFEGCESLTQINIPDSVTSIDYAAFRGCENLTEINIPDNVTSIDACAFESCTNLTSVTVPNGVTFIEYDTFSGCTSLAEIKIPDSVTGVASSAFYDTAWYDNQPDGVVYAGKVVYDYKGDMPENTSIVLKDGTKSVSDFAFQGNENLTEIIIPDGVEYIGNAAFDNCKNLASITLPKSVTDIGWDAFGYYYIDENDEYEQIKIENFTIYGYAGTAAEEYANENEFTFVNLGNPDGTDPTEPTGTEATEPTGTEQTEPTGTEPTEPTEPTEKTDFLIGDVNGDGVLDVSDVTYIQMYLAKYKSCQIDEGDSAQFATADFNEDGIINISDATAIQMKLAGYKS